MAESQTFSIRRACPLDAASIAAVLRASFAEFAGLFDPPSGALSETEESICEKLQSSEAFVAEANEATVGCVFFKPDDGYLYLFRLGVLPNWRAIGIGRALISHVEREAGNLGFERVVLGTRLSVPKNIAYYQGLGYVHTENRNHPATGKPFYAMMTKRLSKE